MVCKLTFVLIGLLVFQSQLVTFDRNPNEEANRLFKFRQVPSPVKDDLGSSATLTLIDGNLDAGSADLRALVDGKLPSDEDQPGANVFFNAGSWGGRFRMEFAKAFNIDQINSYSWHANSRGPQLYKVYGSDGSSPDFNAAPKRPVDPASCGWKFIATVSTIPSQGEDGGQYAVSVGNATQTLGSFRYLLFDVYVTEMNDNWGNTFYSEIDVRGH